MSDQRSLTHLVALFSVTEEYDSAVSRVLGSEQNVNLIKENCVDGDFSQLDRAQTIKLVAELAKAGQPLFSIEILY